MAPTRNIYFCNYHMARLGQIARLSQTLSERIKYVIASSNDAIRSVLCVGLIHREPSAHNIFIHHRNSSRYIQCIKRYKDVVASTQSRLKRAFACCVCGVRSHGLCVAIANTHLNAATGRARAGFARGVRGASTIDKYGKIRLHICRATHTLTQRVRTRLQINSGVCVLAARNRTPCGIAVLHAFDAYVMLSAQHHRGKMPAMWFDHQKCRVAVADEMRP